MLVLSRKEGEQIIIGDDIVVTVVAVEGQRVRLGISAPASVAIRRQELAPVERPVNPQRSPARQPHAGTMASFFKQRCKALNN